MFFILTTSKKRVRRRCDVSRLSPHSSDEEVEDSDHGDADENVQGPLDHGAVHVQAGEQPASGPAAVRGVRSAGVGGGGSGRRGRFGHLIRNGQENPAERKKNHRQNSVETHFTVSEQKKLEAEAGTEGPGLSGFGSCAESCVRLC